MEPLASGAPITIAFEGVISSQGSFVDDSGTFAPGDAISGFWTFDSTTLDGDPAPTRGEYVQSGAPAFQLGIGAHTFAANTATVQILDNHALGIGTIDAYDVLSAPGTSTLPGLVVNQMQLTLRDTAPPLDAMTSDLLPLSAPNPDSFDQQGQAAGQITGFFPDGQLFMNLEIHTTQVLPEPSGWLLAGLGLIGVSLVRLASGGNHSATNHKKGSSASAGSSQPTKAAAAVQNANGMAASSVASHQGGRAITRMAARAMSPAGRPTCSSAAIQTSMSKAYPV